jgi:hypothetical protein
MKTYYDVDTQSPTGKIIKTRDFCITTDEGAVISGEKISVAMMEFFKALCVNEDGDYQNLRFSFSVQDIGEEVKVDISINKKTVQ